MRTSAIGLVLLLAAAGCGTPNPADGGTDVAHAADATDVATHVDVPGVSDVAADALDAAPVDVATDAPRDVAVDAPADVVVDVAADAPGDVVVVDSACARPVVATDSIGTTCVMGRGTCPAGYACQAHEGFVVQYDCQITCRTDCECPATLSCMTVTDKSGPHGECH